MTHDHAGLKIIDVSIEKYYQILIDMMVTFGRRCLSKFSHRIVSTFSTSPKIAIVGTGPAVSLLPKKNKQPTSRNNVTTFSAGVLYGKVSVKRK